MPIQYFDNLAEIGIVKDTEEYEIPANAWTDGQNVRFIDGVVEKSPGHSQALGTPAGAPYFAIPVQKGADYFWFYASLTDQYVTDGSTHNNISLATASAQATADINWNGAVLGGGILVLNNGVDAPFEWTGSSLTDRFAALSNWPAGMVSRVVRSFKQVLVAADIDEGSGRDGTLLRWSHPAAPGAVPTSWDYTDTSKKAGRTTITQGGDFILDMATLRDINMVYKENSSWTMQFVGGRAQYAFRKTFDQLGILSRRCVAEVLGQHIVFANEDIVMHDAHQVHQFLTRRWKRWVFNNIDGDNYERSFVTINHAKNEVWLCFPESGHTFPTIALIWNWKENTVSTRQLPTGTSHIALGVIPASAGVSQLIQDQSGTMADQTGTFDEQTYSAATRYLLMCNQASTLFYQADNTEQFDGTNMTSYIERSALPLGRVDDRGQMRKINIAVMKYITAVWPVIEGTIGGVVNVYFGVRDSLGDTVSWKGPYPYTIGTTVKLDVRVEGRIIDIKFESTTNITWKLFNYGVEYVLGGFR